MIYLDNNATTKIDPRVLEAMMPFLTEEYGNAASNHEFGIRIKQKVKEARAQVASLIDSDPHEVIFTSGATEAINLALKGIISHNPEKNHIITLKSEHKAVLDVCDFLEHKGCSISYLSVDEEGLINLNELQEALNEKTALVCVMLANNETGVIQPLKQIAELAHQNGSFMMTDATQAVGKIPVNVNELDIDLLTFSGHKLYGPKGIGGLYIRSKRPNRVKLEAIIHGGGHERTLRSGTLNIPGIIGIGKAAELAQNEMAPDAQRIKMLRDKLEEELLLIPNSFVNGSKEQRIYNTCNICFEGADADAVMVGLKDIMISNGSACTSTEVKPSHVLSAMGRIEDHAYSSLRISLGRFNGKEDIDATINKLKNIVFDLRKMSSHLKV